MKAKDLMIPASDCARVAEDRTIYDAVVMLEASRSRSQSEYGPRWVLVYDKNFRITGSVGHADMLRALSAAGFDSPARIPSSSRAAQTTPWGEVLTHLREAAHRVTVKEAMHHFEEAEYIDENTPMEEVLGRLLSGPYANLVLTSGNATMGIVRLSDVFSVVCKEIKRSGMK